MGPEALLQVSGHAIAEQQGCGHLVAQAAQACTHQAQVLQSLCQVAIFCQLVGMQQLVWQQWQSQLCWLRHACTTSNQPVLHISKLIRTMPLASGPVTPPWQQHWAALHSSPEFTNL